MKKNLKNLAINNQEDEDGFSLNPDNISIYESTKEEQGFNATGNTKNSESGYAKNAMISTNVKRYANKAIYFPAHNNEIIE